MPFATVTTWSPEAARLPASAWPASPYRGLRLVSPVETMMRKFLVGQQVRLRSGGPAMVFGGVLGDTDTAYLTWNDGSGICGMTAAEDALEAAPVAPREGFPPDARLIGAEASSPA